MTIKSPQTLVSEALKTVKTITPEKALKLDTENKCNLIDIREEAELLNFGTIENSVHIPRGMLEFSIYNQIDSNKEIVLFCAAGGRSALAVKSLNEMGFKNVSHIEGGFGLMAESGFKVKT